MVMTGAKTITLSVNGKAVALGVDPGLPLLSVLRHDLGLKGSRVGCTEGYCGACTVLIDGRPVQSCNTPVAAAAGRAVTTIEGLSAIPGGEPVRRAFLAEQAAQCGYCTNGIIMEVAGLVSISPRPSREAIIERLSERHLCRCGSHVRVLRAIDRVMSELSGEKA